MKQRLALAALAIGLALVADPALAQGFGGDPFSTGVQWFIGGPARGVAMLGVAVIAVAMWFISASLRLAGLVLGGGLVMANIDTIVGWMGF